MGITYSVSPNWIGQPKFGSTTGFQYSEAVQAQGLASENEAKGIVRKQPAGSGFCAGTIP